MALIVERFYPHPRAFDLQLPEFLLKHKLSRILLGNDVNLTVLEQERQYEKDNKNKALKELRRKDGMDIIRFKFNKKTVNYTEMMLKKAGFNNG